MLNAIHVTHEAVYKVGGIGTVLEGLINSRPYRDNVGRTVLVCPLFYPDNRDRLGPGARIEYSSLDGIRGGPFAEPFRRVEAEFHVGLVYGRRPVEDLASDRRTMCETLLVDIRSIDRRRVDELKGLLWEHCGLQSHRFEHIWEFEQYVQLAAPAAAALATLQLGTADQPAVVFAHEFMGVPTAHALAIRAPDRFRTLFHAHEVATIRRIVEEHPGHDTMFYNTLTAARADRWDVNDVFGPQHDYFKHAVIDTTRFCDGILAVGHHVVDELRFLGNGFESCDISLAYNGVPACKLAAAQRETSREHLQDYCEALLGWRPDLVFTHVTRLARSKALWRDLDVLLAMDEQLGRRGQTAVLIVLSTELPRRPLDDILQMESEWEWPLAHREGGPDLTEGEARYYQTVQAFNARARNAQVIYVNQFGFSRHTCGRRVPAQVEFMDLRRGSDVEFGLSLYEPFGISLLEPLTFGGICVPSTSCGCAGFLRQAMGSRDSPNIVFADFVRGMRAPASVKEGLAIGRDDRRAVEREVATSVAQRILERLPKDPAGRRCLLESGFELAAKMSWDVVAERAILPAMRRAGAQRRVLRLA